MLQFREIVNSTIYQMQPELECRDLCVDVANRSLVRNLNLKIKAGSFVCILGTNGVGKTLTLHTLAGLRAARSGQIRLCGDDINSLKRKEISKRLGLLLQNQTDSFPQTVFASALMGRHPHLGLWDWATESDKHLVRKALDLFDVAELEHRIITTLSGGERARVALATLMVQNPFIWLLDEPMNHLDPHHQLDVLNALLDQANNGRIIVSTVHNPTVAMRYASEVLMLYGNGSWEFGQANELLEPERLERVYQTPFSYYQSELTTERVLIPTEH